MPEYTHYEYKMIERRLAGEMARRIGSRLNDSQRNTLVNADKELRRSQDRMREVTQDIVEEILGDRHFGIGAKRNETSFA